MQMYNLLEYSDKSSITSGSLWNYYRNEVFDDENENENANNKRISKSKTITSKSFEHKTKIIRKETDDNNLLDTEVVIPSKCLSNFWGFLDLPLIN